MNPKVILAFILLLAIACVILAVSTSGLHPLPGRIA